MPYSIEGKNPNALFQELDELYKYVVETSEENYEKWKDGIEREEFRESAKNLLHYLALRRKDIRHLQNSLIPWGLSSLGRLESKTLCTLESVLSSLADIARIESTYNHPPFEEFSAGMKALEKNTEDILGPKPEGYSTRIMVTMPTEAAKDEKLVDRMVKSGMNIARVNCSHDGPKVWKAMIDNIKRAGEKYGKEIKIHMDIAGPKIRINWVFTKYKKGKLNEGDLIRLAKDEKSIDPKEEVLMVLGTTVPQVFENLEVDHKVLIDDGKAVAIVRSVDDRGAILEIERIKGDSMRVKAEKGIAFPNTNFNVPILSEKDKEDMAFACKYADIIGCSFVRNKYDIREIQKELVNILGENANKMALMAKIENTLAVSNLAQMILEAASKNPFSVMIARGDLAVEIGYIRLAELQQEIGWICEAASVPVVWATEVFATLVETGVPTRSEVTDVVEGALSECVMLNKGTYIIEAIEMMVDIFKNVEVHQYKKTPQLRALDIARLSTRKK